MEDTKKQRTIPQNSALHLFCRRYADALNDAGWDMRRTLRSDFDISWTEESFKNNVWRPIQDAMLDKESTTELTTGEVSKVADIIIKNLSEKTGVFVDFPHIEN